MGSRAQVAPALIAFFAVVGGMFANMAFAGGTGLTKLGAWLSTLAMIVLLCGCIGRAIAGRWDGVLIDSRNRISLSRMQMVGWTVVVLTALVTAASSNIAAGSSSAALAIDIPNELLAAMGIAAASLAATPALLTLKGQDPGGRSLAAGNTRPDQAGWLDMFRGDEATDQDQPDLSKIQQFLVTLALVGVYAVALGYQFYALRPGVLIASLPALDDKSVWLLGISHAGYLSYKAASKPTGSSATPATPPPPSSARAARSRKVKV